MVKRRSFLKSAAATASVALVAGCTGGNPDYGDGEVDFNVSPSVPQENLEVQYAPIRERLESALDTTAKMSVANNYSTVITALGDGSSDVAETGPFAAALGVNSDNAEIILQRKGYGTWEYKSLIAVRPDSDISSVSDLEGKTVSFSDRLSTSGCLYPLYNMSQAGLDIGDLPEGTGSQADFETQFAGGHAASYQLLVDGQVDAAGMGGFIRDGPAGPSPDEFSQNATTLEEETGLPRAPIVVSPELSDDNKQAVTDAFLDAPQDIYWGEDGEEGTDDDLWFNAVREASVDDYQSVIDVADELGVGTDIFQS